MLLDGKDLPSDLTRYEVLDRCEFHGYTFPCKRSRMSIAMTWESVILFTRRYQSDDL